MVKTTVAVRDVDEETFRKFRAMTVEEKMKLGDAVTLAMKHWLQEKKELEKRIQVWKNPKVKPFDWGRGTERTSNEVDEILYGSKK